ncbi:MAG: hypothetical protein ABIB55_01440 [Candidatus Nealsonbacteria bacterium]
MPLTDILEKIKEETRKEIEEIKEKEEFEVARMEKEAKEAVKQRENKVLGGVKEKAEKFLIKTQSELEQDAKNLLLERKHQALDRIFSEVSENLKSLDENSYQDLLLRSIKEIPDFKKGMVLIADQREKETREFFKNQEIPIKGTVNSMGGFKFLSEDFEIDDTIENLIQIIRSETEMEVINNLFSK